MTHEEHRGSDSAGVPWTGRTLPTARFDADSGEPDPALVVALDGHRAGRADAAEVVEALASARVLVPVVAVLGEGDQASPSEGDKSADMALVTLTGPDGRRALPVFSGAASLREWDAS